MLTIPAYFASPALAAPWGTLEEAAPCEKFASDACQAEIQRRAALCKKDPAMKEKLAADKDSCSNEAANEIIQQQAAAEKKAAADKQKQDAADMQKAREETMKDFVMPKAVGKNAAIEKLIANNFKTLYPDNKILKLLLTDSRDWSIRRTSGIITGREIFATIASKKDDKCELYGTYWVQSHNGRGFSGPLEEHGQGAQVLEEIPCSKVNSTEDRSSRTRKARPKPAK